MSYKDGSWQQRFGALGDESEAVFEEVAANTLQRGFERSGLNRPSIQVHTLPERERFRPDYIMSGKYVECQGFGQDGIVKLKIAKWLSLHFWNSLMPVEMFLWDSANKRWCFVTLFQFDDLMVAGGAKISKFPEGHTYIAIKGEACFEASELVGEVA